MENKLIPMTEFVLQEFKKWEKKETPAYQSTGKYVLGTKIYANFLKQQLTLGMFVPVDENNVPLEFMEYESWTGSGKDYNEYIHKYFEAKERVLFEGFEVKTGGLSDTVINKKLSFAIYVQPSLGYTIETLCNKNLTLTATAIKSIYGS